MYIAKRSVALTFLFAVVLGSRLAGAQPEDVTLSPDLHRIRIQIDKDQIWISFAARGSTRLIPMSSAIRVVLPSGESVTIGHSARRACTRVDQWKGGVEALLSGAVLLKVEGYFGDHVGEFGVEVAPDALWAMALDGTSEDRAAVMAKFPDLPQVAEFKKKIEEMEQRRLEREKEEAEELQRRTEAFNTGLPLAISAKDLAKLTELARLAPNPEGTATAWQAFETALSQTKADAKKRLWVSTDEKRVPVYAKLDQQGEPVFEITSDDLAFQIASSGKAVLLAIVGKGAPESDDFDQLKPFITGVGWAKAKPFYDWRKREAELKKIQTLTYSLEEENFVQLMRGAAGGVATVDFLTRTGDPRARRQQVELNQVRYYLCDARKRVLKKMSMADLMLVTQSICDGLEAETAGDEYTVGIKSSVCVQEVKAPKCP